MNFDAHIAKYNNKYIASYGGQCVANVAVFCLENGFPIAYANAKDWWGHSALVGRFDFITNNPNDRNQVPLRGDIVIWNGGLAGSGGYGHIGIFDAVIAAGSFRSFDANWGGANCHFVTHNYSNIIGWMRPKAAAPAPPQPAPSQGVEMFKTDAEIQEFYYMLRGSHATAPEVAGWRNGSMLQFVLRAKPEVANREQAKRDTQGQLGTLQSAINAQNATITELTQKLQNADASNADKSAALTEALSKLTNTTADLEACHDKIQEIQNTPTAPQEPETGASLITKLIAWFTRNKDNK